MADDSNQRPYRTTDARPPARPTSSSGSDPLAELARLIGQTDPFGEFGRETARRAEQAPPGNWPPPQHFPPPSAPQPARQSEIPRGPAYEPPRYAKTAYAPDNGFYQPPYDADGPGGVPAHGEDYAQDPYLQSSPHIAGEEDLYDDVPPPRRRIGVMAVAAIFGLAVIGTAGAFGYRALFKSPGSHTPPIIKADTRPARIVPAATTESLSGKLITDRFGNGPAGDEKMLSREEQPVDVNASSALTPATDGAPQAASLAPENGSGVIAAEPKKVRTIAIRPDQVGLTDSGAVTAQQPVPPSPPPSMPVNPPQARRAEAPPPPPAPVAARPAPQPQRLAEASPPPREAAEPRPAPRAPAPAPIHHAAASNAPLSLNPGAAAPAPAARPAAPARVATAAPAAREAPQGGGGYAVQLSSQRSEADAEAAFHNMQAKFPSQLGSRKPMIHRVDLGAKGIYFRAMVGPFANGGDAVALCSSLKSAGGQCIVQKI